MVELNPSEKYDFVNWDDEIPNIWENKIDVPNHQPDVVCNIGCSKIEVSRFITMKNGPIMSYLLVQVVLPHSSLANLVNITPINLGFMGIQWEFQDPKMEVRLTIFLAIFWGYIPLHSPLTKGLIYGR